MFIAYWSHSSHLKGTFLIFSICRMIALGPTSITLVMYQNVCLYIWIKNSLNVYNMYYIHGKSEIIPENLHFCFTEYAKALTVWITTNCGKFLKRWEYQTTLLASWEICIQVKKPELELDMEQWTFSKLGKEYVKAVYCHPVYLTYMQSTSCKMTGWMKHKLESRLSGKMSTTSDIQIIPH